MASGKDVAFIFSIFIFLGFVSFMLGMVATSLPTRTLNITGLDKPPTPHATGNLLDIVSDILATMGYLVTSIFGLNSDFAFITGIILIPIMVTIAYIIAKLIRGN
jgi:hypothetical protein